MSSKKGDNFMDRIKKLRERTFVGDRFDGDMEFYTLFYRVYEKNSDLQEETRFSEALYYAFSNFTPSIIDGELIVGSRDVPISDEIKKEWNEKHKDFAVARCNDIFCGQDSHMAIDYERILSKGLNGIITEINKYLKNCDNEKELFYKCCKRCLEGVINHSENYSTCALEMSRNCNNQERKRELEKIAEICKKVPAQPAESFYEALQAVHFITYCITFNPFRMGHQQFQLGHLDRYLLSFYENDIKNKIITKEFAQILLDCLGIQINMRVGKRSFKRLYARWTRQRRKNCFKRPYRYVYASNRRYSFGVSCCWSLLYRRNA